MSLVTTWVIRIAALLSHLRQFQLGWCSCITPAKTPSPVGWANAIGSDVSDPLDNHVKARKFIDVLELGQGHLDLAGKRIGNSDLIIVNFENSDEMTRAVDTNTHKSRLSCFRGKCRAKNKVRGETATAYIPCQIPGLSQ